MFVSNFLEIQILDNSQGGAIKNLISIEIFKGISVSFPNIQEQTSIATYLDTQTAKIDTLIKKSKQAIDLLKEKRTALITAAVTGKIDVRECA